MRNVCAAESASLIRNTLDLFFTGHSISVQKKDIYVLVRWEDGPTVKEVESALENYPLRGSHNFRIAYLFPDGSMSSSHGLSDGFLGCEEVTLKLYRVECQRDISDTLLAQIADAFEKEYGFCVSFRVDSRSWGWNKSYLMYNPRSFTNRQGEEFEQFGDRRQEYEEARTNWSLFLQNYSDYDKKRAAVNFLIPMALWYNGEKVTTIEDG